MLDLYTYIIYLVLLAAICVITFKGKPIGTSTYFDFNSIGTLKSSHFTAILLISLIVGFRYEVGIDWEGYKYLFEEIKKNSHLSYNDQYLEFGYFWINKIMANIGLGFGWLLFSMALLSWYFLFRSVPNLLLPFVLYFLFVDEFFFSSMNLVRQFTAMCIWLFSIPYLMNRDLKKYLLLLFLASLFHKSSLILIPLYFIPFHRLYNKKIWFGIFITSFFIGTSTQFVAYTKSVLVFLGSNIPVIERYTRYLDTEEFLGVETQVGLGFYFRIIVNALLIILSGKILREFPKLKTYFILFFFGAILFNLSYNMLLIGRINNYFLILRPVILAVCAFYFWYVHKNRTAVVGFFALYFILFLAAMYNKSNGCCPYLFSF